MGREEGALINQHGCFSSRFDIHTFQRLDIPPQPASHRFHNLETTREYRLCPTSGRYPPTRRPYYAGLSPGDRPIMSSPCGGHEYARSPAFCTGRARRKPRHHLAAHNRPYWRGFIDNSGPPVRARSVEVRMETSVSWLGRGGCCGCLSCKKLEPTTVNNTNSASFPSWDWGSKPKS